ncbi:MULTISPECIES: oligosaccharide flippase family protein [unclassified Bradyrhizobium]|uniref:oligosaccharide flippase family protein n=1 Tax=unclassified Bradyrhizobium TaxID=2631580 RepID=UPI002916004F|nr:MULTISPECIES: oligosaccharide flippase family protein [unclassified Bradyrhizobium]
MPAITVSSSKDHPPHTRLRRRILRAGAWTLASHGAELLTRLASNLILTRLLFPDAFGMVALSTALIVGLQLVSDFGVRTVIIQSPSGDSADFLRSAWVFQCSRGLLLWLALSLICLALYIPSIHALVPASSALADPLFPLVTLAQGLTLIATGLESTAVCLCARLLDLKPIFRLEIISRLTSIPIMIGWAYISPTVWAVVAGILVSSLTRLLMSHFAMPGPRMALVSKREHIREIVDFGRWINLSSFASFVSSQSYTIVLGILLPGSTLGLFYIAQMLSGAVEGLLERLNGSLTLPVLAEVVRTNPTALRDRYYRFRLPIELVAAGSAGFLLAAGDLIVRTLYDSRYEDAGFMLQIMSFGLLIYPFQLIRSAFTAIARTNIVAWLSVLQAISLIFCLGLGYYLGGTYGAIFGISASRLIPSIIFLWLSYRHGWLSIPGELRWLPAYILGILVGRLVDNFSPTFHMTNLRHILGW